MWYISKKWLNISTKFVLEYDIFKTWSLSDSVILHNMQYFLGACFCCSSDISYVKVGMLSVTPRHDHPVTDAVDFLPVTLKPSYFECSVGTLSMRLSVSSANHTCFKNPGWFVLFYDRQGFTMHFWSNFCPMVFGKSYVEPLIFIIACSLQNKILCIRSQKPRC